jgi:hypothetical protein
MAQQTPTMNEALAALKERMIESNCDGLEHERAEIVKVYERVQSADAPDANRTELVLI